MRFIIRFGHTATGKESLGQKGRKVVRNSKIISTGIRMYVRRFVCLFWGAQLSETTVTSKFGTHYVFTLGSKPWDVIFVGLLHSTTWDPCLELASLVFISQTSVGWATLASAAACCDCPAMGWLCEASPRSHLYASIGQLMKEGEGARARERAHASRSSAILLLTQQLAQ